MDISGVELFGYAASLVIAFSLTRSSIVQLRWINLFGASSFCAYGIIIGAYPVAILNGFVTLTNLYYIRKFVYHTEHNFAIINTQTQSHYLDFFLQYHNDEIQKFFPNFHKDMVDDKREFYVLLDETQVVGLLSGIKHDDINFTVDFDFVIPQYRDCRLGEFALGKEQAFRELTHYQTVSATADSPEHSLYLKKLGFRKHFDNLWYYQER